MKFTFKIPKNGKRIYVTDEHICNGHWIVRKDAPMYHPELKKTFGPYVCLKTGVYEALQPCPNVTVPDVKRVIPIRADLKQAKLTERVKLRDGTCPEIAALILQSEDGTESHISAAYAGLLQLGTPYIKDALSPILIVDGNDEMAAVVMPIRL